VERGPEPEEDRTGEGDMMMVEEEEDDEAVIAARRAKRQAAMQRYMESKPAPGPEPPPRPAAVPAPASQGGGGEKKDLKDPNKLAAQALKLKLKGDKEGHDRLMKEAEEARRLLQADKEEQRKKGRRC
jgi:hypothetical protein